MNRRTFLRSIATVCGAAVVCPGELLKSDLWVRAAALRKKNAVMGSELCYGKHGQYCCCNSCVNDIMVDCLPPLSFIDREGRSGFIITKARQEGITALLTYRGVPIFYQENLSE